MANNLICIQLSNQQTESASKLYDEIMEELNELDSYNF